MTGKFDYRLALDPADLHRTAFGITMDAPFRVQRIGYPALAWMVSAGETPWVPVALVAVNVLALGAVGLAGGTLARDAGRHALWGLLLAGYFGFFMSVGNDLTEPVAAACLLGGIIAGPPRAPPARGGRVRLRDPDPRDGADRAAGPGPDQADLMGAPGAARPGAADLAWAVPVLAFAAWQVVLSQVTGRVILLASPASNASTGFPFSQLTDAVRLNLGLLWPATGAAWIWFLELGTLAACTGAALASLRSPAGRATAAPGTNGSHSWRTSPNSARCRRTSGPVTPTCGLLTRSTCSPR